MESVNFETLDGVKIVGDFMRPPTATRVVLLLHMMPATRMSWKPLVDALTKTGIASLSIDLRGHGESIERTEGTGNVVRLDYKNFTDAQHQASRLDVDAAINFLKQNGFAESAIALAGASIGANLSLDALERYAGTACAVLLSPGLDYRGILTQPPMRALSAAQKVWLIAAEGDSYSAESVRTLHKLNTKQSTITIYKGAEHGTNLFAVEPKLITEIVKFMQP